MVLAELGRRINDAIRNFASREGSVNEKAVSDLLDDICSSLLKADVHSRLVKRFRENVHKVFVSELRKGDNRNKHRMMQSIVLNELTKLIDPGVKVWHPQKGRSNVIMFVGLQGCGKTTTVTKLAHYYQKKGWKTCMVCADTYRAGAYDQLKQNAAKARIPFYGSYTDSDPVAVSQRGVEKFKSDNFEIIIVDTSGRHQQDEALFEEMLQVSNAVHPDNIIYVMDATNGQSCESHARAFKSKVEVASIIVTKLDGHAKGGGALSAVAAAKSPITFIGTGEHIDDFEPFRVQPFVQKLLGMGDLEGLLDRVQDMGIENHIELTGRFERGLFTLRDLYEYLQMIQKMGPLSQIIRSIPNLGTHLSSDDEKGVGDIMRRNLIILDSMNTNELDSSDGVQLFKSNPARMQRVARGAGARVEEVMQVLQFHEAAAPAIKRLSGVFRSMGFGNFARPGTAVARNSMPQEPSNQVIPPFNPTQIFSMLSSPRNNSTGASNGLTPDLFQGVLSSVFDEERTESVPPADALGEAVEFDLD